MSYYPDDEIPAIVFDNGSGSIKAGFAGDDEPRTVTPNVIGHQRHSSPEKAINPNDSLIGDALLLQKERYSIRYPMEHGIVTNWDDMERIWHYTFSNELRIAPENQPVLFSEAALNPLGNREKMTQIIFERFRVPAMYIAKQGILSFYYLGRTAGLLVESGDGVTQTMPINEGYALHRAVMRNDIGGRDLTEWMSRLLAERGYAFTTTAERELVREMKEKHAYVAANFDEEMLLAGRTKKFQQSYKLPDGQEIPLGSELFRCPEALFQPAMAGQEGPGIAELIYNAIMNSEVHIRSIFYTNILLSGGNTLFTGMPERVKKEIQAKLPSSQVFRIVSPPERRYSAWIGGSILASLSTFQRMWITKSVYEEFGPSIVHRNCA